MTTVGVVRERGPGETRVALVPETVERLRTAGLDVVVESGAGSNAWLSDGDYRSAGASITSAEQVAATADILVCVQVPEQELRRGQVLIGLLEPLLHPDSVRHWADAGVTAVSLDLLPRTLSRAQQADALTSQANVAGYKAVLLAAAAYSGYFPMLMTAAGTVRPANLLVLGAGVAGLQAIGTARRLGAVVTAYDVRPESRPEIESLGARYLDLSTVGSGAGSGGYARQLTEDERDAQQRALTDRLARFDVVICTARVPGRRPPVLVTEQALATMRPGTVVVDLAAGDLGGNVEGSVPDQTVVLGNGVTVIGAGNLPATVPLAASTAYSRNVAALMKEFVREGELVVDLDDELQAAVVVTHDGSVVNRSVATATGDSVMTGGTR
jgi:H+-translocating NAD(P) transhydrogenase subunit alpha